MRIMVSLNGMVIIVNALFKYFKLGAANFIKEKQNSDNKQLDKDNKEQSP